MGVADRQVVGGIARQASLMLPSCTRILYPYNMRMAKKKITLDTLAAQIQKGFAAVNARMTKGFASADTKFAANR